MGKDWLDSSAQENDHNCQSCSETNFSYFYCNEKIPVSLQLDFDDLRKTHAKKGLLALRKKSEELKKYKKHIILNVTEVYAPQFEILNL